jgi:hypothetical protein
VSYITGLAGGSQGYFADSNGTPRLFLADEAWGVPSGAGQFYSGPSYGYANAWQNDMANFLTVRANQGFTVITADPYGNSIHGGNDNGTTWDGVAPFTTPFNVFNSSFWTRIDFFISFAATVGITVNLNVAYTYDWGTAGNGDGSGTLFTSMTGAQATAYGVALGNRYGSTPNLIWMFGDDYSQTLDTLFTDIMTGIQSTGDTHAASIEYYPSGTTSHRDLSAPTGGTPFTWGSAYATYNWVYYYWSSYYGVEEAYADPAAPLPVIWADGFFYGDAGSPYDERIMRNMVWWALSSGARGCTTGSDAVFPWNAGSQSALTSETWFAQQALNVRKAFESLPGWHTLVPDVNSKLVTSGRGTRAGYNSGHFLSANIPDSYVTASRSPDGKLAVIYCQVAFSITVDQTMMAAGYTATWIDPASGGTFATAAGSSYSSSGRGNNSAGDPDWALVLQAPDPQRAVPARVTAGSSSRR